MARQDLRVSLHDPDKKVDNKDDDEENMTGFCIIYYATHPKNTKDGAVSLRRKSTRQRG